MNFYLVLTVVLVSTFPVVFADQIYPHLRCDNNEKQTWNEELQKHNCIPTTFVKQEFQSCKKGIDYTWNQVGFQSYEQVICNPITQIIQTDFYDAHVWDYWSWNFVFSNRHGW